MKGRFDLKKEALLINGIPAVKLGDQTKGIYLFVHGQCGCKEEAEAFAQAAVPAGFQVLGIDLPCHGERKNESSGFDPWTVMPELAEVLSYMKTQTSDIYVRANSIGAYFSMLAFAKSDIKKALFVSPIVDMEKLIADMMTASGVTESELRARGEMPASNGQTLSVKYLDWVRAHPLDWATTTSLLYAGHDCMTSRKTIVDFAASHKADLTVYEAGEHWFHTPDQLEALRRWEKDKLRD